ncbi:MAG: phosphatase PAP2 family protein [Bacillota bacterium]|nr:phosphatase PAP2 family protein [Bacillota bacterium]
MGHIFSFISAGDRRVFLILNRRLQCLLLDIVMQIFTQMGSLMFVAILAMFFYFSGCRNLVELSGQLIAVLLISQVFVQVIKRMVNRPRPFRVLENAIAKRPPTCKYSFPSGHTSAAFCIAFALSSGIPGLSFVFFSLASMVGVSRIYLGAHYPTDVLVGYFTAYASFLLNARFFLG